MSTVMPGLTGVFDMLGALGSPFETAEIEARGQTYAGYKNAPPQVRQLWLGVKADDSADYLVYEDERMTYARSTPSRDCRVGCGHAEAVS